MPGQFSDFYNSLDPDPVKRGKQFEYFVKWFLKADPEWSTQVANPSTGVEIVFGELNNAIHGAAIFALEFLSVFA